MILVWNTYYGAHQNGDFYVFNIPSIFISGILV